MTTVENTCFCRTCKVCRLRFKQTGCRIAIGEVFALRHGPDPSAGALKRPASPYLDRSNQKTRQRIPAGIDFCNGPRIDMGRRPAAVLGLGLFWVCLGVQSLGRSHR
jgi:hypothetical protein